MYIYRYIHHTYQTHAHTLSICIYDDNCLYMYILRQYMYITHNKTRIYIHTYMYIYIICTSYTTCATPLLHSTVFRNPNFEAVRIQLVCNGFSCFLVFLLNGCPMPNLTISPREVATEKRNLDPLAGRLVVFLNCMTSPSFLIGGGTLTF